jgi:DNA-binding transcriptional ArsR family regulator
MSQADPLSVTFAALADPTRRAIVAALSSGERTVGELAAPFDISGPAISRHLKVLSEAGLIERKVSARWRVCSLRATPMRDAHDWLGEYRRYWEANLDRLAALLEAQAPTEPTGGRAAKPHKSKRRREK